jgi:nucleoside-diphosphate-sugar epimerase
MPSERLRLQGGRGKVGRAVADAAVADGHRVVLTDVAAPAYGPNPTSLADGPVGPGHATTSLFL